MGSRSWTGSRFRFEQEIYSDFFEETKVEGSLQVDRPGRMRMTYLKGDRKTFIWDGQTCYERDDLADTESWTPQKDVQDEPLVRLLLYGSELDAMFLIDRYKGETDEIYRLRPRNGDPYVIEVAFNQDWLPKYLEIMGEDGEGSRFRFEDYDLDPKLDPAAFTVPAQKPEE